MLIHDIQKRARFYISVFSAALSSHIGHFNEYVQFVTSFCRNWRLKEEEQDIGQARRGKASKDNSHNNNDC